MFQADIPFIVICTVIVVVFLIFYVYMLLEDYKRVSPTWSLPLCKEQMEQMMNVKIRPLNDKIVVRVQEAKEKSEGGIYFPDTAREKPRQGEIVAVGPGRWSENTGSCGRLPMMVKVGDVVVFTQWSGSEVKELGDGFLIMTESDVLGIVEK